MKPILFEANETEFNTNGLGRLADAISCKVTEERNGLYELSMEYPQTGIHFADLAEGRLIYAVPFDGGRKQAFRIYYISEPLNGVVTVNAEHISYLLNKMVVMPFTAGSAAETFAKIPQNAVGDCPFTFSTDKEVVSNYTLSSPREIRRILGGEAGSILDVYGKGEYEFDNFTVILRTNRGTNSGVTLRYGKNITELQKITDSTNTHVGIVPFWSDNAQTVTLPEKVVYATGHENDYAYKQIQTVDFSSEFDAIPTEEQLRTRAREYVDTNEGWTIKQTIKVSFVALWNTEEYKNVAPLERVHLCDTVNVFVKKLNINATAKVVKTVYDVLLERYDSIELGDASTSLAKTIQDQYIEPAVKRSTSHMDKAISHATKLIQGGLGGHVVMKPNADGEPEEILIMDTDDASTAVNVLRINMNGIGFSSKGYNGPFTTAWTLDGHFVADFIDTGTLNANIVKAGILTDDAGKNSWNMETGELHLNASAQIGNSTLASQQDVTNLSTRVTANANGLSAEITRAQNREGELSNSLNLTAEGLSAQIAKKVGDNEVITRINASAEQVSINTPRMNLATNGWNIMPNGSFQLGGIGTDAALSYSVGDDFVEMRNDLSLKLHGIPLGGVRYFFTPEGNFKHDVQSDSLVSLSTGIYTPSFSGTPDTSYNAPWIVSVTQYPYYTFVSGHFAISSNFSAGYLFYYMFPPILYLRKLVPSSRYYIGQQSLISQLLRYNSSNGQYSNNGYVQLNNTSTQTIDGVTYVRYRPTSLIVDRTISPGLYYFQFVYDSAPIPLDELLESGDIYQ